MRGATVISASSAGAVRSHRPVAFAPALTEDERQAALAAGFDEGLRAGIEEGRAEARAAAAKETEELRSAISALKRTADMLAGARAEATRVAVDQVMALAVQLAEAVIGRHLHDSAAPGLDAVRRALSAAPSERPAVARLAPADMEQLRRLQLDGQTAELTGVELVADASLSPGDCIVETGESLVDARLAPAVARLAAELGVVR